MQKKTVAIIVLALLGAPIFIFAWASYIRGVLPPKEPSHKTPYQFEEAFNEQMSPYGMSIDLDSVNFGYGDGYVSKVVPVQCEDGSDITCRVLMTSARRKSLIILLEFEQPYDGAIPDNFQPLFEMLIRVFETPLYVDRTAKFFDGTYDDILDQYYNFANTNESQTVIHVSSCDKETDTLILERTQGNAKESQSLLLRMNILTVTGGEW